MIGQITDKHIERIIKVLRKNGARMAYIDLFCGAGGTTSGIKNATYQKNKLAYVVVGINHDQTAIESHEINNPDTLHLVEDIRKTKMQPIKKLVDRIRAELPYIKIVLWASLECTNFSKAKGGMSRDADSRTLGEHLYRYIASLKPDLIQIENVEEFLDWGPLEIKVINSVKGKPVPAYCPLEIKKKKDKKTKKKTITINPVWVPVKDQIGIYYNQWRDNITSLWGYKYEYRVLNSANYGALTSRKRYFGQFVNNTMDIAWPVQTHAKKDKKRKNLSLFEDHAKLKPWNAVKKVLQLNHTGESIFKPGRIKSDKTFERIYHGLIKFVAGGKESMDAFISKYHSGTNPDKRNRNYSINEPIRTLDTQNRFSLINPAFLMKNFSGHPGSKCITLDGPSGTIRTKDGTALVQPDFILSYHYKDKPQSINDPMGTLTTKDKKAIIQPFIMQRNSGSPGSKSTVEKPARTLTSADGNQELISPEIPSHFIMNPIRDSIGTNSSEPLGTITASRRHWHYLVTARGKSKSHSVDQPAGTLTTGNHIAFVNPQFLYRQFGDGGGQQQSIDTVAGSMNAVPKLNLISAVNDLKQFLLDSQFNNSSKSLDNPAPTQTASRKHFYLINPQWFNNGAASIEQPCFTLIARQDKTPASLICIETGYMAIEVFETDTTHAILIKAFMALYGLADVKMRMLFEPELLQIQGFDPHYFTRVRKAGIKVTQTAAKKYIGNSVEVTQSRVLCEAYGPQFYFEESVKKVA